MGSNRGRYFVLTGQAIRASEMKAMGIVNEVLPRDALLPRARELARELRGVNTSALRATRRVLVAPLKASMSVDLPYGHVLESLAAIDASRTS
jgi:enoyl-CoA hydratase/carnithine racemase